MAESSHILVTYIDDNAAPSSLNIISQNGIRTLGLGYTGISSLLLLFTCMHLLLKDDPMWGWADGIEHPVRLALGYRRGKMPGYHGAVCLDVHTQGDIDLAVACRDV